MDRFVKNLLLGVIIGAVAYILNALISDLVFSIQWHCILAFFSLYVCDWIRDAR